ncbi:DUF2878 domain-containing protein [Pseudoalteromonas pernae]|uniref:DUF2878 domain-containing protein n=1 Tax=Pseudoalteromonas pernae TaxID=3118054 RepID=UPI003241BB03
MTPTLRLVTNFVLFQSSWWAAFFFQNNAVPVMLALAAIMFWMSQVRKIDLYLCATVVIACALEIAANQLGLMSFSTPLLPLWLCILWLCLLLTINQSLRFINSLSFWQCFALCWVAAPFSYLGAAKFGVLTINYPWWQFYLIYGAMWAATFSVIVMINRRMLNVLNTD